jgi:hypothetical protein
MDGLLHDADRDSTEQKKTKKDSQLRWDKEKNTKKNKNFFCTSCGPSRWSARIPVSHKPFQKIETKHPANR